MLDLLVYLAEDFIKFGGRKKYMQDKNNNQEAQYVVAARVGTKYEDCIVAEESDMIIATHTQVFGPASKQKCEQWRDKNCKGS